VLAGLVLGIPLALGAARLIAGQLCGVSFCDPLPLAVAACALGLCSLNRGANPGARRGVDPPMNALRAE
jgi:hypothetical protein